MPHGHFLGIKGHVNNHTEIVPANVWRAVLATCFGVALLQGCATQNHKAQPPRTPHHLAGSTTNQGITVTINGLPQHVHEQVEKSWFFTVEPEPHPVYARDFTTSIHLMSEALRVHRLGKKEEAATFARSAARLIAQRGEAECDLTSSNAVDAAVARAFGYLFEAKISILRARRNETERSLHKAAEAWASVQPYLLSALNQALQLPRPAGNGEEIQWSWLAKEPESICTALARIAGTLRLSGDSDSAHVVSGWKHALSIFKAKSDWHGQVAENELNRSFRESLQGIPLDAPDCDDLYPEIIPDPTDASAPLWVRGVAVRKPERALPEPSRLQPPPLTEPSPK
ncbi:MAG: hypothetical protein WCI73_09245 [Phycisphaerae bacterium]